MLDKSVVLLNSGGVDSFLAGKILQSKQYHIHSLFIHWSIAGEVYIPPLADAAKKTAEKIGAISHLDFPMEGQPFFGGYNKFLHRPCYSSTIYYSLAFSYAFNIGARYIASGHMADDKNNPQEKKYFNATKTLFASHFYGKIERSKRAGLVEESFMAGETPIELMFPLYKIERPLEIIPSLGLSINDIQHTYSCAFYPPCGQCLKCKVRNSVGLD